MEIEKIQTHWHAVFMQQNKSRTTSRTWRTNFSMLVFSEVRNRAQMNRKNVHTKIYNGIYKWMEQNGTKMQRKHFFLAVGTRHMTRHFIRILFVCFFLFYFTRRLCDVLLKKSVFDTMTMLSTMCTVRSLALSVSRLHLSICCMWTN